MVSFYFVLLLSLFGLCSGLVAPTNIRFFRTSTFRTQTKITYQRISRIYADIIDIPNQIAFNEATTRNEVNIPIVIDFQKSNCRPCIKVAPLLRNLANKYENKVKFYKVDADSSKECLMILKGKFSTSCLYICDTDTLFTFQKIT